MAARTIRSTALALVLTFALPASAGPFCERWLKETKEHRQMIVTEAADDDLRALAADQIQGLDTQCYRDGYAKHVPMLVDKCCQSDECTDFDAGRRIGHIAEWLRHQCSP